MTTVDLKDVFLHDASNLDDFVQVRASGLSESSDRPTNVTRRVGGHLTATTRRGAQDRVDVTLMKPTREDLDWIRDRLGNDLLYRDPRDRMFFGVIAARSFDEHPAPNVGVLEASFTIEEVSGSVAV